MSCMCYKQSSQTVAGVSLIIKICFIGKCWTFVYHPYFVLPLGALPVFCLLIKLSSAASTQPNAIGHPLCIRTTILIRFCVNAFMLSAHLSSCMGNKVENTRMQSATCFCWSICAQTSSNLPRIYKVWHCSLSVGCSQQCRRGFVHFQANAQTSGCVTQFEHCTTILNKMCIIPRSTWNTYQSQVFSSLKPQIWLSGLHTETACGVCGTTLCTAYELHEMQQKWHCNLPMW